MKQRFQPSPNPIICDSLEFLPHQGCDNLCDEMMLVGESAEIETLFSGLRHNATPFYMRANVAFAHRGKRR
jgi:hypothetical protein